MERHVYQREETVKLYEESHYIADNIKQEIANEILSLLQKYNRNSPLKILDAGIGGGRLILLPLLDAAIKKNIPLEIIGIDNSKPMIDDLKRNLNSKYGITLTERNPAIADGPWLEVTIKETSSIKVYDRDLENYKSLLNLDTQFDAVISVLTLHHLKNWRLALYSLVKTLKKGGYLILFEWTKGIKLRDGNFVDSTGKKDSFEGIDKQVVDFWEAFYKNRYKYHSWFPEIMASDYSKINAALKKPFFESVIKDGNKFDYSWNEKIEVTWETLRNWIDKGAYSNFYRGLSKGDREQLLRWVNDYYSKNIEKPDNPTNEKLGCRLNIFKKQCDLDDFEKTIIFDSIIESSLYEKLIYEKKEKSNDQRPLTNLATSLIQHDVITNNTSFFTINLWDILTSSWHKEDKPLVFNKGLFDNEDKFYQHVASVLLYYAIIEKFEEDEKLISGTKFIFRELSEKPMITIHKTTDKGISRFFIRNIRTKTVEILLPKTLLHRNKFKDLINTAIEGVKRLPDTAWKPLKEDIWNLIYDSNEVTTLLNKLKDSIKNNSELFNLVNQDIFGDFLEDLKKCFYIDPKLIQPDKEKQIDKFCIALVFHLLITNWDSMIYVPSEVLLPLPGEEISFGFGGLILAEENKNDEILKYYLSKRAEMLRIAINMKFRAIGAEQWAEKMVEEVEKKVNLLEQTYHDINRRYIPPIEECNGIKGLAGLLENKISYLRLLAQGEEERTSPEITIREEIDKIFSLLSFEDKNKFQIDTTGLDNTLKLKGNKVAFISLFENLIGNTCRHACSYAMNTNKVTIKINSENKIIYYQDDGQGFPKSIDNIDIIEKIKLWFSGQFSKNDMEQRKTRGNIRGMGLYIAKNSADFLGWEITPVNSKLLNKDRVQIIFKIKGE